MDNRDDRSQLKRLFAEAKKLPAVERRAFLERSCPAPDVRREIESLLAAGESAVDFLENPLAPPNVKGPSEVGLVLGSYELVSELGRGGMGTVYLARRVDGGLERQVALKLIKRGMDTDDVVRRFRLERQILADLEHPGIARLYEGDSTPDGRPYFVMELIEGVAIDRYCQRHQLDVVARLGLFLEICETVEYAHRKLVIHRDLKPINILVGADGQPKLLDFGIAKLLDSHPRLPFTLTNPAQRPMTLEYASPEQVRGEPLATTSDVYALGVLLYELLTGERPYRLDRRSPREAERAVCDEEPERPSSAVVQPRHGADRSSKLSRRLAGDLDNIILKAMRKEPARRYGSVERLAADIELHLAGYPVSARPDTIGYRMSKFARRHRRGLGAAALVALLLTGFIANAAVQARLVALERDRAERVQELLVDLFREASPRVSHGEPMTVEQLLERGTEQLRGLEEDQDVRASLLGTVGLVYFEIGRYEKARALLEQSIALWREQPRPDRKELAEALTHLGMALQAQEEFEEAKRNYLAALELQQERKDEIEQGTNLMHLADLLAEQGHYAEAEGFARRGVALERPHFDEESHASFAVSLRTLGMILRRQGKFDEAIAVYREAVGIQRRLLSGDDPQLASSLNNLALVFSKLERFSEAEPLYRETLAIYSKVYGSEHRYVATIRHNLGALMQRMRRYDEAEQHYREALDIRRRVLDEQHSEVAQSLMAIAGIVHQREGPIPEVETMMRDAIDIRRASVGANHPWLAIDISNLAFHLLTRGDVQDAVTQYREALRIVTDAYPDPHPEKAKVWHHLAWSLEVLGQWQECEVLARQALEDWPRFLPTDHWRLADARSVLGACLHGLGRTQEAEPLLRESLPVIEAAKGADDLRAREARRRLQKLPDF